MKADLITRPAGVATQARPFVPGPAPEAEPAPPTSRGARFAPHLAPMAALLLGWWSLATTNVEGVSGLGLITVLPAGAWVALAVLLASFGVTASRSRFRGGVAVTHLVALVLLLHGAPALMYQYPRFPTAWLHAGFVDHMARTGDLLPQLDARFSWAGFFTAAAGLCRLAGITNPVSLLAWFPAVMNLLYLLPFLVIARSVSPSRQTPWIAAWFFFLASWVGQDYFSPQGVNLYLYLAVLAVVFAYFRPQPETAPPAGTGRVRGFLHTWQQVAVPTTSLTTVQRAGLIAIVLGMGVASIVSHQLTPIIIVAALAALRVSKRTTLKGAGLILFVAMLAYISFGAHAYWIGHFNDIFGDLGQFGKSVNKNVGDRVRGADIHREVIEIRMIMAGLVAVLGGLGLMVRLRRTRVEPAILILAALPILLMGMQSYGGEAVLRVYLFALPFLVLSLALGLTPTGGRRRLVTGVVGTILSVGLVFGFYVSRFGNDEVEFTRPAEIAALDWLYDHAAPGSRLFAYDQSALPWRYRDVGTFDAQFRSDQFGSGTPQDIRRVAEELREVPAGGYVVLTAGQEAGGIRYRGQSEGWITELAQTMVKTGDFRVVYRNRDADILRVNRTTVPPKPKWDPEIVINFPATAPVDPLSPLTLVDPAPPTPPADPLNPLATLDSPPPPPPVVPATATGTKGTDGARGPKASPPVAPVGPAVPAPIVITPVSVRPFVGPPAPTAPVVRSNPPGRSTPGAPKPPAGSTRFSFGPGAP